MLFIKFDASLQFRLLGAAATHELDFFATFYDGVNALFNYNSGQSSGTDVVTIVPVSGGQYREIKFLSISNKDTAAATIVLEIAVSDDQTTPLLEITLDVGDTLTYTSTEGFRVIDESGEIKITNKSSGGGDYTGTAGR